MLGKYEERTNGFIDHQGKADGKQQAHLQSNILTQEMVRKTQAIGLGNPFTPMYYFLKGEVSDIKAMELTLVSRQNLIKAVPGLVSRRKAVADELQEKIQGSISLSLSTLKTMFKNS